MTAEMPAGGPIRVEVWSDVVCPWCYIGKRRLEGALAAFGQSERVEVIWRSYQLDPGLRQDDAVRTTVLEHLAAKYGSGPAADRLDQARQMMVRVQDVAAGEGLRYDLASGLRANTLDSHRLLHAALADGGPQRQGAVKERLLAGYFTERADLADRATLARLAVEGGLASERAEQVLACDEYADAVHADQAQAQAFGATGVPFFVVDRRHGVTGAQSVEVLTELLRRAGADRVSLGD